MKLGTHNSTYHWCQNQYFMFCKNSTWPQFLVLFWNSNHDSVSIQLLLMKFGINIIGLISDLKLILQLFKKAAFLSLTTICEFILFLYILSNYHFQLQSKCLHVLWKFWHIFFRLTFIKFNMVPDFWWGI